MKILFISHYGALYGANRSLLSMMLGLRTKGIECVVLCSEHGAFTERLEQEKIEYKVTSFYNWAEPFLFPKFWLLPLTYFLNRIKVRQLKDFIETIQPDIIHSNSSVISLGAYLGDAYQIPHVFHIREFARLHYNSWFFPLGKNLSYWSEKSAAVIYISQKIKETLRLNPPQSFVIYVGVFHQNEFLYKERKLLKKGEQVTFLTVGLLHPSKRVMEALQAFAELAKRYSNIKLNIVGEGQRLYTWQLKRFVRQHQLTEKVIFHGYVNNPSPLYESSDVLLMCSRHEGMGRVNVEAMRHGMPVIGYDSGGIPELIEDGYNGFIYNNYEQLVAYMESFVSSPEDIKRLGENGFERAKSRFIIEDAVEATVAVYEQVLIR